MLKNTLVKIFMGLGLCMVLTLNSFSQNTNRFPQNGQRYLAWMLFNFDNNPDHSGLDLINLAAQGGSYKQILVLHRLDPFYNGENV